MLTTLLLFTGRAILRRTAQLHDWFIRKTLETKRYRRMTVIYGLTWSFALLSAFAFMGGLSLWTARHEPHEVLTAIQNRAFLVGAICAFVFTPILYDERVRSFRRAVNQMITD